MPSGGGVVGLAVARKLSEAFADRTTFLVERHTRFGEETRWVASFLKVLSAFLLRCSEDVQLE